MTTAPMRLTFEDGPAEGLDVQIERRPTGPPQYLFVKVRAGRVRVTNVRDERALTYLRQSTSAEGGVYRVVVDEPPLSRES